MNETWTFESIPYKRPDFPALDTKIRQLSENVTQAPSYEEVRNAILEYSKLMEQAQTMSAVAMGRAYHDVTDNVCQDEFSTISPQFSTLPTDLFSEAVLHCPYYNEIKQDFGDVYFNLQQTESRLCQFGKEERAEEDRLADEYRRLKSSLRFSYRGEAVPESVVNEALISPDRAERKEAYEALGTGYLSKADQFEALLQRLIDCRLKQAKENQMDYITYANLMHHRYPYGDTQLLSFVKDIKAQFVPIYLELQERQRKTLGLEELMPYDTGILFSDGNAKPIGGEAEMAKAAADMYDTISPSLSRFFRDMKKHHMMDIGGSPNKISGMGYCNALGAPYNMPFVFANSNGTADDVPVYTHELGHAYAFWLAVQNQPIQELYWGNTDMAEIPSKTMELFTYPHMELFFGKDAEKYREGHLYGIVKEICAYTLRYEYERWLYTHPHATLEERTLMHDRISKEYGRNRNNESYMEQVKQGANLFGDMAVFMFPFYVISYVLSDLCALQLKKAMDEDPQKAWDSYNIICKAGGSLGYEELMKAAGLESPFAADAVEHAAKTMRDLLGLA